MGDSPETGTAVERYFFSPLYFPRSAWAVLRWWESRRLFYNLSVGTAGLVTIAAAFFFSALPPHPAHFSPAWVLVPIYGILANLCYSLGAPLDLLLRRSLGERAAGLAQALFRYGYAFSIGLTLFPIPLLAIGWLLRWFLH